MRHLIPTINDDINDFEQLFVMQEMVRNHPHIIIDFSRCGFLRQNAVAFLGGLARFAESQGRSVTFDWDTVRPAIQTNLARNGFLGTFGGGTTYHRGNAIRYHEDVAEDKGQIAAYLQNEWLGPGWVSLSSRLRDVIVSNVVEVYDNTFAHANSSVGIISCGQHYPNLRLLKLTAVDFGVGIPANVRRYRKKKTMSAAEAIEWALQPGTTTKPQQMGRGLGLNLLQQFVKTNDGKLEIFSGGGYVLVDKAGERYQEVRQFEGTLINITIRCDESFYHLQSEDTGASFF